MSDPMDEAVAPQEAKKRVPRVREVHPDALEALLAGLVPRQNDGWISKHRPSKALLCCIGSGPWRLPRRTIIQEGALSILGELDIIEKRNELAEFFPLDWQKELVLQIGRYCHLVAQAKFDSTIDKAPEEVLSILEAATGRSKYMFPKVLCMYVRDYLEIPIVPRDRHVNELLQSVGLPTDTQKVTEALIARVGASNVNAYARSMFLSKSSNPQLP